MKKMSYLLFIMITISVLAACNKEDEETTTEATTEARDTAIADRDAPTFNPLPFISRSGIVLITDETDGLIIDKEVFGVSDNVSEVEDITVEVVKIIDGVTSEKYDLSYNVSDATKAYYVTLKATDEAGNSSREEFAVGIVSKEDLKTLLDGFTIPMAFTTDRMDYFKTEYNVEALNETTLQTEEVFIKLMRHLYRLSDDVYTRYEVLNISDVTKTSSDIMDVYTYSVDIRDHFFSVSIDDRNDTDYIEYTYNMKIEVLK
ncbi:hypothetical protein [Haloplasma contractile]|uniref:Membrane lipoprotein n=1 Tax=Haloplasma contractile SSD-17B TaxID=1033810 RepID=F7PW83_9MOLU|nr:hypothetical protein [Haloplasma contractile]ERJ11259.1 membrane lipoprotein [Haloplasma contractile SSD-17B]